MKNKEKFCSLPLTLINFVGLVLLYSLNSGHTASPSVMHKSFPLRTISYVCEPLSGILLGYVIRRMRRCNLTNYK